MRAVSILAREVPKGGDQREPCKVGRRCSGGSLSTEQSEPRKGPTLVPKSACALEDRDTPKKLKSGYRFKIGSTLYPSARSRRITPLSPPK